VVFQYVPTDDAIAVVVKENAVMLAEIPGLIGDPHTLAAARNVELCTDGVMVTGNILVLMIAGIKALAPQVKKATVALAEQETAALGRIVAVEIVDGKDGIVSVEIQMPDNLAARAEEEHMIAMEIATEIILIVEMKGGLMKADAEIAGITKDTAMDATGRILINA